MKGSEMKINYNDVFLIDDDEHVNFYNEDLLSECKSIENVKIHDDCNEALEFIDSSISEGSLPGIWLVDINMPKMNGFQFLDSAYEKLKKLGKLPKVYMLTSSTHLRDKRESEKRSYIIGFINKPLLEKSLDSILVA